MIEFINITNYLTNLFATYKDEVLISSLVLNICMLLVLLMQTTRKHEQIQQDKIKAAIYNPKPFRKDQI